MFPRGIEIGVIADLGGQQQFGPAHGHEGFAPQGRVVAQPRLVVPQQQAQPLAELAPDAASAGHQRIEGWAIEERSTLARPGRKRQKTLPVEYRQIEDFFADRCSHAQRGAAARTENAERQVLNWKMRFRRNRNEAVQPRIGRVGHGSQQSQDRKVLHGFVDTATAERPHGALASRRDLWHRRGQLAPGQVFAAEAEMLT